MKGTQLAKAFGLSSGGGTPCGKRSGLEVCTGGLWRPAEATERRAESGFKIWSCLVGKHLRRQLPLYETISIPTLPQSHGQISSLLSRVDLPPDRLSLVWNRPTPERPQPPCTFLSPGDTTLGSDLILSRLPFLQSVAMPLLCVATGLNPTILIFLVVALLPTRPAEETPKPQQFRPKSTIPLASCATTSRR